MIFVDTHSHLYVPEFDSDRKEVIARADEVGIKYHILPDIDSSTTEKVLSVSSQYPGKCFPLIGLHPTSVKTNFEKDLEHVEQMLADHKFFGIGEIGIDLYWDKTYFEQQKGAFRHQLKLAKKHKLPVVIHSRNSFDEIFSIVDQENDSSLAGVFHSFSGNIEHYKHIKSYKGFKVGIGGVVTYKNGGVDKLILQMELADIILETDTPWLSPVPKRGHRNESQNLIFTAQKVAELVNLPLEEIARITTINAQNLFNFNT